MRAVIVSALLIGCAAAAVSPGSSARARTAKPTLPALQPPLGRIGDVLQPSARGGTPANEVVVTRRFPGCDQEQQVWVSRFLFLGAGRAAEQIEEWLNAQPKVKAQLFGAGKDPLADALGKARASRYVEGTACAEKTSAHLELAEGGRITALEAPPALCSREPGPPGHGDIWLFARAPSGRITRKDFAAAVALAPADENGKDACLPRLSAALFDPDGRTRLVYDADFNGALSATVYGDKCQQLAFRFDPKAQQFVPEIARRPGCAAIRPRADAQ